MAEQPDDIMPEAEPVRVKKGQEIALDIDTLAFGGRGVGRLDGLAVFVDGAVPGDRVQARIVRKKKRFAEARLLAVDRPSGSRPNAVTAVFAAVAACRSWIMKNSWNTNGSRWPNPWRTSP